MTSTQSARNGGSGRWLWMRVLGMLVALAALAGCGGDPAPGPGSSTPPTPTPNPSTLSVTMTNSAGATSFVVNRNSPLTVTATLLNGSGQPIANSLVQLALSFVDSGTPAALTLSSGITDSTGKFSTTLSASSTSAQGGGTLTATAPNAQDQPSTSVSFQVTATTPPVTPPVVSVVLTDPATGASRNTLSLASPLNATATVVDSSGNAVPNSLVQFSLATAGGGAPVAVFSPASGNGLTDANGKFTVGLQAAGLTAQGAGTLTATAVNELNAPSSTTSFQVGATPITLGNVTRSPEQIDPLQTSTITVQVTGVPATVPVAVRFTSACASTGLATLPATAVTVNGVATAVYTDKGCSGTDAITISADGASSIQTTLSIKQTPPVAIQFVEATPTDISIFGVGGQPTSVVVFKVVNVAQQPVADLPVTLTLLADVSGVTLDGQGTTVTKRSAADGTVRVTVVAGTQAGSVRVSATANNGALSALSSLLSIHTSLPVQNRFSLSIQTLNIEGWNVDGTSTAITIRAADRLGNPVPDGTTINFRSSGAMIDPVCRTSSGLGTCSVTLRSQENRPASGRVAILAWAVGEESFFDTNGNNRYDAGEPFADLGDAFVDNNLNGVWNSGTEEFVAYYPIGQGVCAPAPASVPGAPGVPDTCDGIWGLAHVRDSGQVVLSGSTAFPLNLPASVTLSGPAATCAGSFSFTLRDVNGNPMPAGTTITATINGGTATVYGSPVVNTVNATTVAVDLTVPAELVEGSDPQVNRCMGQGVKPLRLQVTTPLGTTTVLPVVTVIY